MWPSPILIALITLLFLLDEANDSMWYESLPRAANPADLPSRSAASEVCTRFDCEHEGDVALTSEMHELLRASASAISLGKAIYSAVRVEADMMSDVLPGGGEEGTSIDGGIWA